MKSDDPHLAHLQVIKHTLLTILGVLMIGIGIMALPDYKLRDFKDLIGGVFVIGGFLVLILPALRLVAICFKQLLKYADEVEQEHQRQSKGSDKEE